LKLLLAGVYENLKATLEKLEPRFTLRLRRDGKSPEPEAIRLLGLKDSTR
jgi:hypothetical protein